MVLRLRKVDRKYLKIFETWCWRSMLISWIDLMLNEELLQRI